MLDVEESGSDRAANGSSFEISVVGTAWNVGKGSNQLSTAEEETVFQKFVSQEVEGACLHVRGGLDRRRHRGKKFDCVGRSADGERDEKRGSGRPMSRVGDRHSDGRVSEVSEEIEGRKKGGKGGRRRREWY